MRTLKFTFVNVYLFTLFTYIQSFGIGNRVGIRIDRLEPCKTSANCPFQWDEVWVENQLDGTVKIKSKAIILRDIPKFSAQVEIKRCAVRESLDSCQPFAKLSPLDTCSLMSLKGMAWTGIMEAFEPKLKCPIKAGVYTSRNQTMDPNKSFYVPIENWYWKIIFKVIFEKEFMDVCLDFQGYVVRRQQK